MVAASPDTIGLYDDQLLIGLVYEWLDFLDRSGAVRTVVRRRGTARAGGI